MEGIAEALRDLGRATARWKSILLPGFAAMVAVLGYSDASLSGLGGTFGGFLTLVLLLIPSWLVFGLIIHALRSATFDLVRKFFHDRDPPEGAPATEWYGLFANLGTLWITLMIYHAFRRSEETDGSLTAVQWFMIILSVLVALGLITAALDSYHKSFRGRGKKKRRKKA